jgi:hypothetical protein
MLKLFESYSELSDFKEEILLEAIYTEDLELLKKLLNKGYKVTEKCVLESPGCDKETMTFLLKNIDIDKLFKDLDYEKKNFLEFDSVQEILIELGEEQIIYSSVGFKWSIKNNPKYKDIIDRYENVDKFNL